MLSILTLFTAHQIHLHPQVTQGEKIPYNAAWSATAAPLSITSGCPSGVATRAIETYASGTSTLQNLGDGYYQLNWKTLPSYSGSCKKLTLKIGSWSGDGFSALFWYKK